MTRYIISLVGSYLNSDLIDFWFYPMICLGLLYIFPSFVRSLFSWR